MGTERYRGPAAAKWKDLLTAGIDLPSIWPKKEFEQMEQAIQERRRAIRAQHRPEADMEALFREEGGHGDTDPRLRSQRGQGRRV